MWRYMGVMAYYTRRQKPLPAYDIYMASNTMYFGHLWNMYIFQGGVTWADQGGLWHKLSEGGNVMCYTNNEQQIRLKLIGRVKVETNPGFAGLDAVVFMQIKSDTEDVGYRNTRQTRLNLMQLE